MLRDKLHPLGAADSSIPHELSGALRVKSACAWIARRGKTPGFGFTTRRRGAPAIDQAHQMREAVSQFNGVKTTGQQSRKKPGASRSLV